MKVSIIIPCYNSERYLKACMDSVLAQSMPDFEAILIDDGSVDATLKLAKEIAASDSRVSVYHQENSGVCAARNLGLDHACGEWITFVDSDDLLPADALETMLSAAEDHVDMVVCAHETFDEQGNIQKVIPQSRWMDCAQDEMKRRVCLRLIEGDCVLNIMCNKLHRKSVIDRDGLRLVPGVKIAEDALFNLEAVICGNGIAYVNRITYRYRTHSASAMHTQTAGEFQRHEPWLNAMRDMLMRRRMMGAYYSAYLDSVVLRLYKDGGVFGVLRHFSVDAAPLLPDLRECTGNKSVSSRLMHAVVRAGLYPAVYPMIWFVQTVRRKCEDAAFALRSKGEMPK